MVSSHTRQHCHGYRFDYQYSFILLTDTQHLFVVTEEHPKVRELIAYRIYASQSGTSVSNTDHFLKLLSHFLVGTGRTSCPKYICKLSIWYVPCCWQRRHYLDVSGCNRSLPFCIHLKYINYPPKSAGYLV